MHIHIVGICGTFMGGIAALAKQVGIKVTGCDANVYPPMSTQLEAMGIELIQGFDATQIDLKPDVFVIGNVVTRGNPLMEAIMAQGLPYTSGPQWLAENILRDKWVLAVAGTHGKTTTASMLAWVLEYAGLAPGFLIGGIPQNFGVSARLPQTPAQDPHSTSPFFVMEADEYDTAFFDKRSKFVHYHPRTVVLNNLEYDHADIFPDLAAIETQFHHLIRTVPNNGLIVSNAQAPALTRVLARGSWSTVEAFGAETGWHLGSADAQGHFEVFHNTVSQGVVAWDLMGEHNRLNALAVIAAARHAGVSPSVAIAALGLFQNVKRRMEVKGTVNGITVYDDFAHHPTAITTTIAGLRHKIGKARIIAVLEPRSNTMKLGTMKAQLPNSLQDADLIFCYANNLDWDVAEAMQPLAHKTQVLTDLTLLVNAIAAIAQPSDHVLVMSNGGFGGIHQKLLAALA